MALMNVSLLIWLKQLKKLPWIISTIQKLMRKRDKAYTFFWNFRSEKAKNDLKVPKKTVSKRN